MKKLLILVGSLVFLCLLFTTPVAAVAGGHGGGSSHGGSSRGGSSFGGSTGGGSSYRSSTNYSSYGSSGAWIRGGRSSYFEIFLFGGIPLFIYLRRKNGERKQRVLAKEELFQAIPGTDKEKKQLLAHIETSFMQIQWAWDHENPEEARAFSTERLLEEHKRVIEKNQADGLVNRVEKLHIESLENYRAIGDNSFSIHIDFTCLDYMIDRQRNSLVSGSKHKKQLFAQTWYFDYDPESKTWKADFIQPIYLN
ncbi:MULTISPECIES: TIM44-like domain-containing protein [unclassified Enterococcus]|jgi:hypothetical protein|uniref:TIM44-like domain-containing protein n=1 Tax=unclassified Enterococcus TaxID=2608891 RepID=UPI003D2A0FEB